MSDAQHTQIRILVKMWFFTRAWNDEKMLLRLTGLGYPVRSVRTVQRIRLSIGCEHRVRMNREEKDEAMRRVLDEELRKAHAPRFGRTQLWNVLSQQGFHFARDRMWRYVCEVDPEGVAARTRGPRGYRRRGAYIVPGVNKVWSIDAHCKLEHFGFQIYGCIDAYSRYVIWAYVGISSRTKVSVLRQYCEIIQHFGFIPEIIRSDHGIETDMIADCHFQLSNQYGGAEFNECFFYGTSRANQRIESFWGQTTKSSVYYWQDYFKALEDNHLWSKQEPADRIALLAVYMPIIRLAIHQFTDVWNRHKIRKQRKRPWVVPGRPQDLYDDHEGVPDFAVPIPNGAADTFMEQTADWDPDEYLPEATLRWCRIALEGHGHWLVNADDVDEFGVRRHVHAYILLRQDLQEYFAAGNPMLVETQPPSVRAGWRPHGDLVRRFAERGELYRFHVHGVSQYPEHDGVGEMEMIDEAVQEDDDEVPEAINEDFEHNPDDY